MLSFSFSQSFIEGPYAGHCASAWDPMVKAIPILKEGRLLSQGRTPKQDAISATVDLQSGIQRSRLGRGGIHLPFQRGRLLIRLKVSTFSEQNVGNFLYQRLKKVRFKCNQKVRNGDGISVCFQKLFLVTYNYQIIIVSTYGVL